MSNPDEPTIHFRDLNLPEHLITALDEVGYESPSPIQAQAIPHLLAGLDLLGRAPTGTGKTAAFALPLLSRIDPEAKHVQVLTLCPTRELAIQVAEAFQRYASHMPGFHVLPIYGGAEYGGQLRMLRRGVQVVVGTPGRIMDHMRKGTLKLDKLQALVLDEADEMLRMGFKDEVEWILEQTPERRQMALFSATMPSGVERIARTHLNDPQEISIKSKTATAETIRQRYWLVSGLHKLDALTRILEVEPFDAILMFVRTKITTTELAEKLEARGYAAAALNGDMAQAQREQMVNRLKRGSLDILVATDIAARGLDVDRISHVVNYDIPYDTEAYIHRIGRTGRAGRSGEAILFVAPRERRMLKAIEKATRQPIEELELPTTEVVTNKRIAKFKQQITDTLAASELNFLQNVVEQYEREHNVPAIEIAAALSKMLTAERPLEAKAIKERKTKTFDSFSDRPDRKSSKPRKSRDKSSPSTPDDDKERYRINVGYRHGVRPGNIVGAIANEGNMDSDQIGHIEIETNYSLVDLPKTLSKEVFEKLKDVKVSGKRLDLVLFDPKKFKGDSSGKPKSGKKPFQKRDGKSGEKRPYKKSDGKSGEKRPFKKTASKPGEKKPFKKPEGESGEKKSFKKTASKPGEKKPFKKTASKPGEKKPFKKKASKPGDKKPSKKAAGKPGGKKPKFKKKPGAGKKPGASGAKKPAKRKPKKP